MHPLLARQLARSLGREPSPELDAFLQLVDATYNAADEDRRLVERSLDLTSTELLQRNEALRQEIERRADADGARRAVIESALDCIILLDGAGTIVEFNPAAEATFGFRRDEAVGRSMATLILSPEQRAQHAELLQRQLTADGRSTPRRIELTALRKDGQSIELEVAIAPFRVHDQPMFAGYLRDITAKKKSQRALELAYQRLKEVDASRQRFLNSAAHELSTPLTPIRIQMNLLERSANGHDHAGILHAITVLERNVDRLGRMVADLLDGARLQAGRMATKPVTVDLRDVIDSSAQSFAGVLAVNRVHLDVRAGAGTFVHADADRLQQVLDNLLANAAKFSPVDGTITIRVERQGTMAHVDVVDQGIGIAPEDLPKLFQPFVQLNDPAAKDRALGGTGLGLFISRGIIEASGGTMTVTSEGRGKGATFHVELPLVTGEATAAASPAGAR